MTDDEIAAAILEPYFAEARSRFAAFSPEPGFKRDRIKRTQFLIDRAVRTSERHYAATRDDGAHIIMAPEAADLSVDTLRAMVDHEFGHVDDFAHPSRWMLVSPDEPAIWLPPPGDDGPSDTRIRKAISKHQARWEHRSADEIEWTADAIAWAVTGKRIRYCGKDMRCMLQCFRGGVSPRPKGLR